MKEKKCSKCNQTKAISGFGKNKKGKYGVRPECNLCRKSNRKHNKDKQKEYREKNKEYYTEYNKQYRENNKEYFKEWRENNKEHIKKWRLANKDKIRKSQKAWLKDKRENDVCFNLRERVSCSVRQTLRRQGATKGGSVFDHLPYTPQQLKKHLESQFESWMSWDNWGVYDGNNKVWHIDHIYPQSKLPFDNLKHPNFKKCWALENLMPIEARENLSKGAKLINSQ